MLTSHGAARRFLDALVADALIELAADVTVDALAQRLVEWASDTSNHDSHVVVTLDDWLIDQDEVAELLATREDIRRAFSSVVASALPTECVSLFMQGRPSLPALVDDTSRLFTWYAEIARSVPKEVSAGILAFRLHSPTVEAFFVGLGANPFVEYPEPPSESMHVELDPVTHGEQGEEALDPSDAEIISALLLASRIQHIARALRALHHERPFELRLYDGGANDLAAPFVVVEPFGPMPAVNALARALKRALMHPGPAYGDRG